MNDAKNNILRNYHNGHDDKCAQVADAIRVADMYEVPVYLGQFPAKSSFVIGPDREIHYVYDWLFRPRNHVAKILAAMSDVTERREF